METKPSPEETVIVDELHVCLNCSNEFSGKYCNKCGEKVISQHDRTVAHYFEGVFHMFTHLDSKFLKSVKVLFTNPGSLATNYAIGRRLPFMKPVALFFVGNLIYFLFPFFSTFTTTLYYQKNSDYGEIVAPQIERKMEARGMTFDELAEVYNEKTVGYSKLILILLVPLFGIAFWIMNFRRRPLFADHLLMGLEFMCYTLFYNTIILSILLLVLHTTFKLFGVDINPLFQNEKIFLLPIIVTSMIYYVFRAQRTFYADKILPALLKATAFLFATLVVITLYRFILFEVTMFKI